MRIPIFISILFFSIYCLAQVQDKVDFISGQVQIIPNVEEKRINGVVEYKFEVLANVDSIFLDAKNMEISEVRIDGKKIKFNNDGKAVIIQKKFKQGKSYDIELRYSCIPKQAVYFFESNFTFTLPDVLDSFIGPGKKGETQNFDLVTQIWTQGQGKYTSHWLPSFDDMNEKIEFDLSISIYSGFQVIANGKLVSTQMESAEVRKWNFDMQKPMSSYLLAFVIGDYKKQEITSSSGIPIENYYYPADSLRVEPTYRYTKKIFDFLESEIGFPYPWQNYKQVPVRDFLYAGMENTGATIFSDGYVIDSTAFIDKNYVNVNAHEMAHQWFGDLVTEKDGNHHWLHEGFATFYAYLGEKEIFGDDYFYWKLYDAARQLQEMSNTGKGEALTDPKSSSLTFYEKGAWALLVLRNNIGEKSFKKGITSYLQRFQYSNATISDFIKEMEQASGQDLRNFTKEWLNGTQFPYGQAKEILTKNNLSINDLFNLQKELTTSLGDTITMIQKYWDESRSVELKKRIISNYGKSLSIEFFRHAFTSGNLEIRQALSFLEGDYIPSMKDDFETLLDDPSYFTKENALYKLWTNFPVERAKYLDKTKGVIGFPSKNIRLLWLTLAVLTNGYEDQNTKQNFDELSAYTSPIYSFEVRQGAFQFLNEAFGFTDQNLLDLIQATTHHAWQFKKYARDLLDKLLKDEIYRERIRSLVDKLLPEEKRYIESKLK